MTSTTTSQHQSINMSVRAHLVPMGTLLLVEDSRCTSDLVRLIFRGAGGRLRRVDTLMAARQHLALYTPDVALVDLGLPDGSGLDLIRDMNHGRPRVSLIIAMSGMPGQEDFALAAGADHFVAKPFDDLRRFRALLGKVFFPLRHTRQAEIGSHPDLAARRDDLVLAHDLLCGTKSDSTLDYALHFTFGLAQTLRDPFLAQAVADARANGRTTGLAALLGTYLRGQPLV